MMRHTGGPPAAGAPLFPVTVREDRCWQLVHPNGEIENLGDLVGLEERLARVGRNRLVVPPEGDTAVAPCVVPEIDPRLSMALVTDEQRIAKTFTVVAVGYGLVAAILLKPQAAALCAMTLTLAGAFMVDAQWLAGSNRLLEARTRWAWWLAGPGNGGRIALGALAVMSLVGLMQLALEKQWGGDVRLWDRIGVMYPRLDEGEYWRLITGSLLHYSPLHFGINSAMVALIAPIAWHRLRLWLVPALVGIAGLSLYAQYLLGSHAHDNAAGISGGVNGVLALLIVGSLRGDALVPRGVGLLLTVILVLGIVGPELLSPTSATTAHLFGALLGGLLGMALAVFPAQQGKRRPRRIETPPKSDEPRPDTSGTTHD
jgi:membrane associated rhomboid family serine protease